MEIENQLRNRVASTWTALQSAKRGSREELDAFRRYCEALNQAGCYAAEQVKLARSGGKSSPMKAALRVLAAINEQKTPSALDVASLRESAPHARHLQADELACEVIQQELRRRPRTRSAGSS